MNKETKIFKFNFRDDKDICYNNKYREELKESINYHNSNLSQRLPYSLDTRNVISFYDNTTIEGIDKYGSRYLLLFEAGYNYICFTKYDDGRKYVLLLDNKIIYIIDDIDKYTVDSTSKSLTLIPIPSHIRLHNIPIVQRWLDTDRLTEDLLYYNLKPYNFNIEELLCQVYSHEEVFLNKTTYDMINDYKDNSSYYSNTKYRWLNFNQDLHLKYDDNIIYFEKGKSYKFTIINDVDISIYGIDDFNLYPYYQTILNATTEDIPTNMNNSFPNIVRNISTLDIDELISLKDQEGVLNDDIIIYDQYSSIFISKIIRDNNIDELFDFLETRNQYGLSIIYGRVLENI